MTLEQSVRVPLDADATFALLTEPERLRRWQAVTARVDLRAGGDFRWTITAGHTAAGTYVEVEPGRRLVYTWGWEGSEEVPPGSSTVTLTLEPAEGGTMVSLRHEGLSETQASQHQEGWNHYLDRLLVAAEHGDAGADPWGVRATADLDSLAAAEESLAVIQRVTAQLVAEHRELPTPCAKYDVHQLMEHLLNSLTMLGAFAGAKAEVADDVHPEEKIAVLGQAALEAWRTRGTDGTVPFGDGPVPAVVPVDILALELLVHAWDFATAIGVPAEANDDLVAFVLGRAKLIISDDQRNGDAFAEEQVAPETADALTRLAAFTGRRAA